MPRSTPLDPQTLLTAYSQGMFPMAGRDGRVRWYTADPRGVLPLDGFHAPATLRNRVRRTPDRGGFEVRVNSDFEATMRGCTEGRADGTWINDAIVAAYVKLHTLGFAHSVECWRDGTLQGGLYGVSLGGAFFGESMFHRATDASKVALVHLVDRLNQRGYVLLDTQATTGHLRRFGAVDIPAEEYLARLEKALRLDCEFA